MIQDPVFIVGFISTVKIGIEIAKGFTVAKIQINVVLLRLNIKPRNIDEEKVRRGRGPFRECYQRDI
jgi:hypothetical protein